MKMKYLIISSCLIFINYTYPQQDSTKYYYPALTIGVGFEMNLPSQGIHLFTYFNDLIFGFNYILPSSSSSKDVIKEINNGYTVKIGLTLAALIGPTAYFPLYIGVGHSYINEKSKVLDFTGNGHITGYHYFIGASFIKDKLTFWKRFGGHFEIGYSSWNFDDSILKKNNSESKYNYSKIFGSLGLYFYIF